MEVKRLESGLVVPTTPPEREYGRLELRNKVKRKEAKEAFALLWKATGLNYPGSILPYSPNPDELQIYHQTWSYFATMLLGEDVPDCEQLT